MAEQKALYIDGNWVTTSDTVVNTNPSDTHDVIGEYAQASSEHVNNALAAANRAVGEWGGVSDGDPLPGAHGHW